MPFRCATPQYLIVVQQYKISKLTNFVLIFPEFDLFNSCLSILKGISNFKTELITKNISKLPPIPDLSF